MVYVVAKRKTSVYVDEDLWARFRLYALRRGLDLSSALEEAIRDEMVDVELEEAISGLVDFEDLEIDFEPVEPKGSVSGLVRVMRDEREGRLSG